MSLLHGEVRPTCSANGQKVAIIGTLTLYIYIYTYTDTNPITLPCSLARAGNYVLVGGAECGNPA